MLNAPLAMGQRYAGTLSRFCFPPDADAWWNQAGSSEVTIVALDDEWIWSQHFRVHRDGRRECMHAPTEYRQARLADFQKDLDDGILVLQPNCT